MASFLHDGKHSVNRFVVRSAVPARPLFPARPTARRRPRNPRRLRARHPTTCLPRPSRPPATSAGVPPHCGSPARSVPPPPAPRLPPRRPRCGTPSTTPADSAAPSTTSAPTRTASRPTDPPTPPHCRRRSSGPPPGHAAPAPPRGGPSAARGARRPPSNRSRGCPSSPAPSAAPEYHRNSQAHFFPKFLDRFPRLALTIREKTRGIHAAKPPALHRAQGARCRIHNSLGSSTLYPQVFSLRSRRVQNGTRKNPQCRSGDRLPIMAKAPHTVGHQAVSWKTACEALLLALEALRVSLNASATHPRPYPRNLPSDAARSMCARLDRWPGALDQGAASQSAATGRSHGPAPSDIHGHHTPANLPA